MKLHDSRRSLRGLTAAATTMLVLSIAPSAAADGVAAGQMQVVSTDTSGGPPGAPTYPQDVSPNGRFAVFASAAGDIVAGDAGGHRDIFVVDRLLDRTELVSVSSTEVQGSGSSWEASISDDGRRVAFSSDAINLVTGDTNGDTDIFVRDRLLGTTSRASTTAAGTQVDGLSAFPQISGNGLVVAFQSVADGLVPGEVGQTDIFTKNLVDGSVDHISQSSLGADGNSFSGAPSISTNGQVIAFESDATNLLPVADSNGDTDVFLHDRSVDQTSRVSVASGGAAVDGNSNDASISGDGRYIAFQSVADTLTIPPVVDDLVHVFVHDRVSLATNRADVTTSEVVGNGDSFAPSISADGDRVAFQTFAPNLGGAEDEPGMALRDFSAGSTTALPAHPGPGSGDGIPVLSPDGRYVLSGDWFLEPPGLTFITILAGDTFTDVGVLHPFFEDISWLVDTSITTGFPDDTYRPGSDVTRQAMAAFLYRLSGSPVFAPPLTPTFSDVPTDHPFFAEIEWAVAEGLADGFPDDTFRPGNPITRQAMAAFLYRLAGEPAFTPPGTSTFTDVGATHPFRKEIEWMAEVGLANGFADGGYHPGDDITRQAAAAFLFRFELLGL